MHPSSSKESAENVVSMGIKQKTALKKYEVEISMENPEEVLSQRKMGVETYQMLNVGIVGTKGTCPEIAIRRRGSKEIVNQKNYDFPFIWGIV